MARISMATVAAVATVGLAAAQQATTTSAAGVVTKMSIDDLRAVFDGAGVAYEVGKYDNGLPYLKAAPEGYLMFVTLIDCPTSGVAVDCVSVAIDSGAWSRKLTEADINVYNASYRFVRAVIHDRTTGEPSLVQSFSLSEGVSPNYVRGQLKTFVSYMKEFGSFQWMPSQAGTVDPAPSNSGFSVTSNLPTLGGSSPTLREAGSGLR